MRDYGRVFSAIWASEDDTVAPVWTDHTGRVWPAIQSGRRLKFKNPLHAAVRAFVFYRDGYKCVRCGCAAIGDTKNYDGRYTLQTNTMVSSGFPDMLVVDHVLTLRAGGRNAVDNFQTLCETCNRKKIPFDNEAARRHKGGA